MRRIPTWLVVILIVLAALVLYLAIAKPVVALPPLTVALPPDHPLRSYLTLLKVQHVDLTLRTTGRLSLAADGQRLAFLTYNTDSLATAVDLASRVLIPQSLGLAALGLIALVVVLVSFPLLSLTYLCSALMTTLWVYFIIPVELTLRLTGG